MVSSERLLRRQAPLFDWRIRLLLDLSHGGAFGLSILIKFEVFGLSVILENGRVYRCDELED